MKVALVHDWFNNALGGAEQTLFEMAEMFPDAPVYTLIYDEARFKDYLDPARVRTSFLQRAPAKLKKRPRYLLPLIPQAIKSLKLEDYDVVISSSSAFAKNISVPKQTLHICYCHTPMRFIWDYAEEYLNEQGIDGLQRQAAEKLAAYIRKWDKQRSPFVDKWIANSNTTAARIKKYYGTQAEVIYPPVHTENFHVAAKKQPYYLTLATLTPYKKIDMAIEACNLSARELYVVGEGNDLKRLQALAKDTIHFTGYVSQERKQELLAQAQGLIFPSVEDFGIAPVEAMASGTPVIAYNQGGLTESVIDGKNGLLFNKQTPEALSEALDKFETLEFNTKDLKARAQQFDSKVFRKKLSDFVEKAYKDHVKTN